MSDLVDRLAQAIRMADGNHSLGAGVLAEALLPTVNEFRAEALEEFADGENTGDYGYGEQGSGWYERSAESVLNAARSMADDIRKGTR